MNKNISLKNKLRRIKINLILKYQHLSFKHNSGYCTICEKKVVFFEEDSWLRDHYKCNSCYSIPRNRALANALNIFFPDWRNMIIHESSPGGPLSDFLKRSNKEYSSSHYYSDIPRGEYNGSFRSEDISELTFDNESMDLFISSDVFEHVIEPEKAFKEIARVLKPGGAHVFTMPWYPQYDKSRKRASLKNGAIVYLEEPVYHGNPISKDGSLVTTDWGKDFCDIIYQSSGLYTTIYLVKNRKLGLEAEFLEVFVSAKSPSWLTNN